MRALLCFAALLCACSVDDLDEQGKRCTSTCPSGLPCVDGICGGAQAFCATNPGHGFCADFETGELADDFSVLEEAGTIRIDHDKGKASSSSLLTTVTPGVDQVFAHARRPFIAQNGTRVELDLFVQRSGSTKEVQPVRISIEPPPDGFAFMRASLVIYEATGPTFELGYQQNGGSSQFEDTPFALPFEDWVHVVFDWSFDTGSLEIFVDGETAATPTTPAFEATQAVLAIGAGLVSAPSSDWKLSHDNVLIDAR